MKCNKKQNNSIPLPANAPRFLSVGGFLRYHVEIGVLLDKSHDQHHTVLSLPVVPPSIRHAAVVQADAVPESVLFAL